MKQIVENAKNIVKEEEEKRISSYVEGKLRRLKEIDRQLGALSDEKEQILTDIEAVENEDYSKVPQPYTTVSSGVLTISGGGTGWSTVGSLTTGCTLNYR